MLIKVHEYTIKSADRQWDKPAGPTSDESKNVAWQNWQTLCVQTQPGWVASLGQTDIDENTRRRSYTLDVGDTTGGGAGAAAITFWTSIRNPDNRYYKAFKDSLFNDPSFVKHKFMVTFTNEAGEETVLVQSKD